MKRFLTLFFVLLISSTAVFAACDIHEKMKAEKIAYITDAVGITSEEAVVFWPVYNEWWSEMRSTHGRTQKSLRTIKDLVDRKISSERECEKAVEDYILNYERESEVMRKYYEKFIKVISIEKVLKLYKAEEDFRIMMIRKFRDRDIPENRVR